MWQEMWRQSNECSRPQRSTVVRCDSRARLQAERGQRSSPVRARARRVPTVRRNRVGHRSGTTCSKTGSDDTIGSRFQAAPPDHAFSMGALGIELGWVTARGATLVASDDRSRTADLLGRSHGRSNSLPVVELQWCFPVRDRLLRRAKTPAASERARPRARGARSARGGRRLARGQRESVYGASKLDSLLERKSCTL